MELVWTVSGGIAVLDVSGSLDSNTAPEMTAVIEERLPLVSGDLGIDLSGVDYISSAGLRVILKANHQMSAGGKKVILCGLKDYVREVFELAGLGKILDIREAREQL